MTISNIDDSLIYEELIDEESDIYKVLNKPLLLGVVIRTDKENKSIALVTPNSGVAVYLNAQTKLLVDYFKKPVLVVVNPSALNSSPSGKEQKLVVGRKKGILGGTQGLNLEYVIIPYVVGESNKDTYNKAHKCLDMPGNLLYLFGISGTGKTHLVHKLANICIERDVNVYLTRGDDFVETIKTRFLSRNERRDISNKLAFKKEMSNFDVMIIDDFQHMYNKNILHFISEPLFEIIVQKLESRQIVIISSDTPPTAARDLFHERVTNRLMSGIVEELLLPTDAMKMEYIDQYCEKNELQLPDEMKRFITDATKNFRATRGLLNYCHAMQEDEDFTVDKLITVARKMYGVKEGDGGNNEQSVMKMVNKTLKEYFGISQEADPDKDGRKRKPRNLAAIDNICFYLLEEKVKNKALLKRYLEIKPRTEAYCKSKGAELYLTLSKNVKSELNNIITGMIEQ